MATDTERAASKAARHAKKAADAAAAAARADDANEEGDELAGDVRVMLDGLPTDVDVRLYRKNGSSLEFCQSYPEPKDFSEEHVQKKWGPGIYRLIVRVPDAKTGKLQFLKGGTRVFRIAETPNAPTAVAEKPTKLEDSIAAQYAAMMMNQLQMMNQMMLQGQESHRAMLAAMMQPRGDSSMELMKVLLPVLMGNKSDPMDMAVKLANLLKPAGPTATMTDQLDALGKMMELAAKLGDKGSDDGPAWLSALKTAAPLIQQALSVPRPDGPSGPRPPVATPGPAAPRAIAPAPNAPAPAPVSEPATETEPAHPLLGLLDYAMPSLIRAAERDGEPELYAEWLLDQIPDDQVEALDMLLQEATVLDQLALRYPIAPVRSWFERLVVELKKGIEVDGEGEPAAQGEPDAHGDGSDQ